MASSLSSVLDHFEELEKIPSENVEPLVTPTDMVAVWRADEVKSKLGQSEAMANAPETIGNLFKVPPVVG